MSGDLAVAQSVVGTLAIAWTLPAAILTVECLASLFRRRRVEALDEGPRPTVAVLMPAHDEERGIGGAIDSVRAQLRPGDRLAVVAHNCRDATAQIARDHGADAHVVDTPDRVGKQWALVAGFEWLAKDPRDVVIVVDADCRLGEHCLDRLARAALRRGGPVQASYLLNAPEGAGPRDEISGFALVVRNLARPLGLHRLGLPTLIFGSGLTLPWAIARDAPLDTNALAEDYKFTLDLARRGVFVAYCPEARIDSWLPTGEAATTGQRRRWEHGHLTLLAQVPSLLLLAVRRRSLPLAALAADLAVPPLTSFVLAGGGVALAAGALAWFTETLWPLVTVGAAGGVMAIALIAVRSRHAGGRPKWRTLLALPLYVLWKIPIYLRFFGRREKQWLRTKRDGE